MTSIPSAILTAILILAREILRSRGLRELPTSAVKICRVMQVSRSQAYAMKARLEEALERLYRTPGPSPRPRDTQAEWDLLVAIRDFLMANPGSVETRESRRIYHQTFRDFVIEQLGPGGSGASLTHDQIVEVVAIPLGTLKDWLAHSKKPAPVEGAPVEEDTTPVEFETSISAIATILKQYQLWKGSFQGFCKHLWTQWRIPYRRTFISRSSKWRGFASLHDEAGRPVPGPRAPS